MYPLRCYGRELTTLQVNSCSTKGTFNSKIPPKSQSSIFPFISWNMEQDAPIPGPQIALKESSFCNSLKIPGECAQKRGQHV